MQALGRGGDREANLAKCRAGVAPKMHVCVQAALNAANGRANVAIEIYKNGKPKADVLAPGNALPAGFVAPPRTIADITAVLDNEKPEPMPTPSRRRESRRPILQTFTTIAPLPARCSAAPSKRSRMARRRSAQQSPPVIFTSPSASTV
jgi:hypothetical protein